MATNCVITFDHPNGVYNSGDTLNGHIRLQTEKSKSIRAICIKIIGTGKVSWSESRGGKSKHFHAQENFLNSVNYVLGSPDGESFDLEPGTYDYTFQCDLPIQLPMSLQEEHSKIKYKVVVTIDRRLRFDNEFKQEFLVNRVLNLNWMTTNNREPRINMKIMEPRFPFKLGCCNSGEIKVELQVPCDGFAPGQQIPFQLIVYNNSNIDIPEVKVKFMKCFIYNSTDPYEHEKLDEKKIIVKVFNDIPRHTNREFKDTFDVPHLPPTFHTKFIKLHYIIRAKVHRYWMKKIYVDVPVTIGTIPIADFDPNKASFSPNTV